MQCGSDLTMYFPTVGGSRGCRKDSEAGVANLAFRDLRRDSLVTYVSAVVQLISNQLGFCLLVVILQIKGELEVRWYFPTVGGSCGGRSDSEIWLPTKFSDNCGRIRW